MMIHLPPTFFQSSSFKLARWKQVHEQWNVSIFLISKSRGWRIFTLHKLHCRGRIDEINHTPLICIIDKSGLTSIQEFRWVRPLASQYFHVWSCQVPYVESVPGTGSTLSCSNFPRNVLRLGLHWLRSFNPVIISSVGMTGWVSSWIWTARSSILSWNRGASAHSSLFVSFPCCCAVVIIQRWANNFSRLCSTTYLNIEDWSCSRVSTFGKCMCVCIIYIYIYINIYIWKKDPVKRFRI